MSPETASARSASSGHPQQPRPGETEHDARAAVLPVQFRTQNLHPEGTRNRQVGDDENVRDRDPGTQRTGHLIHPASHRTVRGRLPRCLPDRASSSSRRGRATPIGRTRCQSRWRGRSTATEAAQPVCTTWNVSARRPSPSPPAFAAAASRSRRNPSRPSGSPIWLPWQRSAAIFRGNVSVMST